ncbi:MAG: glycogen synthase [Anaerolineae bacterium]
MNNHLNVLFLASESVPFAKVGGLADVANALPKALRHLGLDARLLIPWYGGIRSQDYEFRRVGPSIGVPLGPGEAPIQLLETEIDDLPVYLIWNDQYLSSRKQVYGFNNDPQRFTFFSRAVIAALPQLSWKPDVIHANDWHTAPVVSWLKYYGRDEAFYKDIATLYTIHNLAYQGICGRLILRFARMEAICHLPVEPPGQVNWMAQGIANADLVNTVSPTYAGEILSSDAGMGLEALLQQRKDRFFGVLNGIDVKAWNPATDPALPQVFDVTSLRMRSVNKAALQREAGLRARDDIPLLGVVSRLDRLKGLDIMIPALETMLAEENVQAVVLGTGDPDYETQLRDLQARFPEQLRAYIRFDERLARQIYGGVDIFLMPSLVEAGGLGQMLAMRYGAVPVVRATGGLADTVTDLDDKPNLGTGFVFRPYTAEALVGALRRALFVYRRQERWQDVQRRAMQKDFSWGASARTYIDLYRRAIAVHPSL